MSNKTVSVFSGLFKLMKDLGGGWHAEAVALADAMREPQTLLTDVTTSSSSDVLAWSGGQGTFSAWGTWDGATASLEWSPDAGSTWMAVGTASTLTADGVAGFDLGVGHIRATVSDAGGSTSLSARV